MDKKYQKERVKLAVIYFFILLFIVSLYSFIVVQTQNQQLRRFDRVRENIERRPPPRGYMVDWEQVEEVETLVEEIKAENLKNIILLNAVLLILGSFLSFYLSGRTLGPILETLNKQKRFVSDASHELKTPLTNIKTEAEVLNRSKKTNIEEYKEFTSNTIEDINRLNDLVNYLLDAARFEDGKISVNFEEVNLPKLIEEISHKFEKIADAKEVKIAIDSAENSIITKTDKNLFERLISIILENAIKYNKKGGEVMIKLKVESRKKYIHIKDTGVGIHPDNLPRIFDRFYRESEDRNIKGFGLGLSIAQQLAKELNIDVEVDSTFGEGTEFILILNS